MMNKITLSTISCLALAASTLALAGPNHNRHEWEPPSAEQRVERMTEELGLDENQAASLLEIFTATDLERDALREQHEKLIRQDVCALKATTTDQIQAVLTPEQAAKFDELMARKAAHHEEHGKWRGKHRGPPPDCDELTDES
jgi:Spy/CpxP family protein refolding chaperone